MKNQEQPEFRKFLSAVKDRIAFREAHSEVEIELSRHLADSVQEAVESDSTHDEAVRIALQRMGDADEIGARLNQVDTPRIPWLLLVIVFGMLGLGIFNVIESHQLGSHTVNILIGSLVGFALYRAKPSQISRLSSVLLVAGYGILGVAAIWGERYQGIPYLKFLCFNLNAAEFSLAPFILAYGGLLGSAKPGETSRINLIVMSSVFTVLAYLLIGSMYGAVLIATAVLAMMVAASICVSTLLLAAVGYSIAIGFSIDAKEFLSADSFAVARAAGAHTDFVLSYFHQKSSLLGALGIFLTMAVVAQLGTLLMQVRSRFSRVLVVGHLSVLGLGIVWSVLANLGYVAMPLSGTPVPFISYGGSFLVGQMALMGLSVGLYWRRTLSLNCGASAAKTP